MPEGTPWWKSKTLWVNVVGLAVVLVETLTQQQVITVQISAAVLGALNIVLRLLTDKPITK